MNSESILQKCIVGVYTGAPASSSAVFPLKLGKYHLNQVKSSEHYKADYHRLQENMKFPVNVWCCHIGNSDGIFELLGIKCHGIASTILVYTVIVCHIKFLWLTH